MVFDNSKWLHQKKCLDAYEKLKETIKQEGFTGENHYALECMNNMESELKKQKEKIEEYHAFFGKLSSFLPKTSSITDRII